MIEEETLRKVAETVAALRGRSDAASPWDAMPGLIGLAGEPIRMVLDQRNSEIAGCPIVVVERADGAEDLLQRLTPREREVAALIGRCHPNKEIARTLGIGVGTVKDHVHAILSKLGLASRTELVSALAGSTLVASGRR